MIDTWMKKCRWRNLNLCIGRVELVVLIGALLEMFAGFVKSE